MASSAANLLQRRAIQCSFSSVFHLKTAGGMDPKDAKFAENVFTGVVGFPIVAMALAGLYVSHFGTTFTQDHHDPNSPRA